MITLLLLVALIGCAAWALCYFLSLSGKWAVAVQCIAGVGALILVLNYFGVFITHMPHQLTK